MPGQWVWDHWIIGRSSQPTFSMILVLGRGICPKSLTLTLTLTHPFLTPHRPCPLCRKTAPKHNFSTSMFHRGFWCSWDTNQHYIIQDMIQVDIMWPGCQGVSYRGDSQFLTQCGWIVILTIPTPKSSFEWDYCSRQMIASSSDVAGIQITESKYLFFYAQNEHFLQMLFTILRLNVIISESVAYWDADEMKCEVFSHSTMPQMS